MYKLTISDGREINIFEDSFRKACEVAEKYVNYYYGFAAHKMDYELKKLTETSTYHEEGSRLKPIEETHTPHKEKLLETAEYNQSVLNVLCNLQNAIDELNEVDNTFISGTAQGKLYDAKRTIATIQGDIIKEENEWD